MNEHEKPVEVSGHVQWLIDHLGVSEEDATETVRLLFSNDPEDAALLKEGLAEMMERLSQPSRTLGMTCTFCRQDLAEHVHYSDIPADDYTEHQKGCFDATDSYWEGYYCP